MAAGPKWKRFEQMVAAIHFAESRGAEVNWNDVISGRQFDVTLRFKQGLHQYLTVIECKDKESKVPASDVDAFVTKSRDARANKAVMVSARGYQSGCMAVADRHGVKLLVLSETAAPQIDRLIKQVVPIVNFRNIRFELEGGGEYELEDVGGRLAYLASHVVIFHQQARFTPHHAFSSWLSKLNDQAIQDQDVRVNFKDGAEVEIPDEGKMRAVALKFHASMVNAIVTEGPRFDQHILESMYTNVELRNVDGSLEHSTSLKDIPFGFATRIAPGKFYTDPKLHMNYYCERIEGNIMHMMLVESYQHGIRIAAEFTADKQFSEHYVEIKDIKTIERLRKIRNELLTSSSEKGG